MLESFITALVQIIALPAFLVFMLYSQFKSHRKKALEERSWSVPDADPEKMDEYFRVDKFIQTNLGRAWLIGIVLLCIGMAIPFLPVSEPSRRTIALFAFPGPFLMLLSQFWYAFTRPRR